MSPLSAGTSRLKAPGSGAHHDNPFAGPVCSDHQLRNRGLPTSGRVLDADRVQPQVETVDAVGGTDAHPDAVPVTPFQFGYQVRISQMGPGHSNQVNQLFDNGVPG